MTWQQGNVDWFCFWLKGEEMVREVFLHNLVKLWMNFPSANWA